MNEWMNEIKLKWIWMVRRFGKYVCMTLKWTFEATTTSMNSMNAKKNRSFSTFYFIIKYFTNFRYSFFYTCNIYSTSAWSSSIHVLSIHPSIHTRFFCWPIFNDSLRNQPLTEDMLMLIMMIAKCVMRALASTNQNAYHKLCKILCKIEIW